MKNIQEHIEHILNNIQECKLNIICLKNLKLYVYT